MGDVTVVLPDAPPLDASDSGRSRSRSEARETPVTSNSDKSRSHSKKSLANEEEETAMDFSMVANRPSSSEPKVEVKAVEGPVATPGSDSMSEGVVVVAGEKRRSPTPTSGLG